MRHPHVCPLCNGTGKRTVKTDTTAGSYTTYCRACSETGIVWEPLVPPEYMPNIQCTRTNQPEDYTVDDFKYYHLK